MTTYTPPKKNAQYIFYVALRDQSDTKLFKASPTLASGDFKISKDGGSTNNLSTLPTNTPTSSVLVKVTLSATEMNADNVTVIASDAAGSEWCDLVINIQTAANQFDDLNTTTPPTAAAIADQVWEETLADHSGTSGSTAEALDNIPNAVPGANEITWTINDGSVAIDGVDVWITSDSAGTSVVWSGNTDSNGIAKTDSIKPFLNTGTYYGWLSHSGYSVTIPVTLAVS